MDTTNLMLILSLMVFLLVESEAKIEKEKKVKLSQKSATDRGLVKEGAVKTSEIVKHHRSYCEPCATQKQFTAATLGYVTPWNSHGYDVAKIFGGKFTMISPVWLQLKRSRGKFTVEGAHDIDKQWVQEVRKKGAKILPRMLFDQWVGGDFVHLFSKETIMQECAKKIAQFIKKQKFDGVTLEVVSQLGGQRKNDLDHFLVHVGEALHGEGLLFVLVIPPAVLPNGRGAGMFVKEDFEILAEAVDYFSLMTYDYSDPRNKGPNSPLPWVEENVRALVPDDASNWRQKILLGTPFYGYKFNAGQMEPVVGNQFIDVIKGHGKGTLDWFEEPAEHAVRYKSSMGENAIFFPSLASIQARLNLASKLNTGLSIWEIGQGLDYFYDLL